MILGVLRNGVLNEIRGGGGVSGGDGGVDIVHTCCVFIYHGTSVTPVATTLMRGDYKVQNVHD